MFRNFTQGVDDVLKLKTKDLIVACSEDRAIKIARHNAVNKRDAALLGVKVLLAEEERKVVIDNTFIFGNSLEIFMPKFSLISDVVSADLL